MLDTTPKSLAIDSRAACLVQFLLQSLILLVFFTGFISACARSGLGLNIVHSNFVAIIFSLLLSLGLVQRKLLLVTSGFLIGALWGLLFSILLWQTRFFGMPVLGGADAANHLLMQSEFIHTNSNAYSGFTSLYAQAYWFTLLLNLNFFEAFRLIVYSILPIFFGMLGYASFEINGKKFALSLVCLSLFALVAWFALVPRFHYFQADGFFANLLSILAIALIWLVYSLSANTLSRLGLSLIALVLLRFTYGLNLGEAAITLALLSFAENLRFKYKIIFVSLFGGIGLASYWVLGPVIWKSTGGIIAYGVPRDIGSLGILVSILSLTPLHNSDAKLSEIEKSNRSRVFCIIFGLITITAAIFFSLTTPPPQYYVNKYLFAAAFLLTAATSIHLVHYCISMNKHVLRNIAVALCFLCAIWLQCRALSPYQRSWHERLGEGSRTVLLQPLLDEVVVTQINNVLSAERKEFGGYITGSWPQAAFTNALLLRPYGLAQYRVGEIDYSTGHCIFWNANRSTAAALRARQAEAAAAVVEDLNLDLKSKFIKIDNSRRLGLQCR